jgi:hypothetical protein
MNTTSKNTTPDVYDDAEREEDKMTQEEILMSESDLLKGLIELGQGMDNPASYKKIQIKRDGKLKLEFRIRPLSEDESQKCWRQATKYAPTKPGQPKKAIDTNHALFRSYIVYTATVDEDRAKLWDNKLALEKLGLLYGVYMIDKVLLSGEKDRVIDEIDNISGYNEAQEEVDETAKNL